MSTNFSSTATDEYNYTVKYNKSLHIFRYIDDILIFYFILNDEYNKMYSDCLQLNKANISYEIAIFLDILFCILNNNIKLDLYEKRNSLYFFARNMP